MSHRAVGERPRTGWPHAVGADDQLRPRSSSALDHLKTKHLDGEALERKVEAIEAAEAKQGAHEPVRGYGQRKDAIERHLGRYLQCDLMDLVHIEVREVTIEGSHTENLRGSSEGRVVGFRISTHNSQ